MKRNTVKKEDVKQVTITEENAGRRIDNYLIRYFGKIPRSRIYQMLRRGEIRVNKGRVKQTYRLVASDIIRIPPVYQNNFERPSPSKALQQKVLDRIIYEDAALVALDKPAGIVVHGGAGQANGIIETIRVAAPQYRKLELVHRLDKETSGCLLLAKTMPALRQLHKTKAGIKKSYYVLLVGRIFEWKWVVDSPLKKNVVRSGERVVTVNKAGKCATTRFFREKLYTNCTLANVELVTGRTHQIRVHSASLGHSIAGDTKYGDCHLNQEFRQYGLKRLFLHARSLELSSPADGKKITLEVPLPPELQKVLDQLQCVS